MNRISGLRFSPLSLGQIALPLAIASFVLSAQATYAQLPEAKFAAASKPTPEPTPLDLPDAPLPVSSADSADVPQPQQTSPPLKPANQHPDQNAQQPSLGDLGLSPDQVKPDADLQARLDRRTHMLRVHQRLGLLTLAPLAAACISSAAAPPDPRNGGGNSVGRDIHLGLGGLSVAMYGATAYYAIRAPRVGNDHTHQKPDSGQGRHHLEPIALSHVPLQKAPPPRSPLHSNS